MCIVGSSPGRRGCDPVAALDDPHYVVRNSHGPEMNHKVRHDIPSSLLVWSESGTHGDGEVQSYSCMALRMQGHVYIPKHLVSNIKHAVWMRPSKP